jgi:hypothetical protein
LFKGGFIFDKKDFLEYFEDDFEIRDEKLYNTTRDKFMGEILSGSPDFVFANRDRRDYRSGNVVEDPNAGKLNRVRPNPDGDGVIMSIRHWVGGRKDRVRHYDIYLPSDKLGRIGDERVYIRHPETPYACPCIKKNGKYIKLLNVIYDGDWVYKDKHNQTDLRGSAVEFRGWYNLSPVQTKHGRGYRCLKNGKYQLSIPVNGVRLYGTYFEDEELARDTANYCMELVQAAEKVETND